MELRLNVAPRPELLQRKLEAALRAVVARPDFPERLAYGSTAGRSEDREAAVRWLRPLLGQISAEDVVIGAGGVSLLVALLTTFAAPGDTVVTEALTYPGIRAVCRHFRMRLVGVEMDQEGLVPASLIEACARAHPRILYCTPTIQNPTTATMSRRRRSEIAEIAEAFDLTILEDDAYGMLPSKGVPPVATFAPDRTFYMSSLSKCLSPALRIAYCVGPRARRAEMTEGVRVVIFLASQLNAGVATQLINDGSAQEMLDAIRAESVARQTIARQSLEGFEMAAHREGPHAWLQLPGEWHVPELGALLRDRGIAAKGDGFAVDGVHPNALRVALGAPASREQLTQVLATLRSTIEEEQLRIR